MINRNRLLKLLAVVLMLVAATLSVNKTLFGRNLQANEADSVSSGTTMITSDAGRVIICTKGMDVTIEGYAGAVPLNITIADGRITDIEPLPNSETPSFFKRASSIIDNWIGKTPAEAREIKVDVVSGATYTSNAIISNVNAALAYYDGIQSTQKPDVPWKIWVALFVTFAACIVPLFVKSKIYYNVQLIANVIVLGFWTGQFLDFYMILDILAKGVALPVGLVICVMLVSAFIYPIFGKPHHYCTHVCPLGSVQILAGQLCGYKVKISRTVINTLDWFRRLLWGVLMLTLWVDCWTEWMDWELFQAFQFESAAGWIIGVAIAFILLSLIVSRPYCRFVCPTGSIFKFIDTKE